MDAKDREEREEYKGKRATLGARLHLAKGKGRTLLREGVLGFAYGIMGYLLAGAALPFGATPLGVALLCGASRRVFYIYAGLCLAAWTSPMRWLLIGAYTAALGLRLLSGYLLEGRRGRKTEENTLFAEALPLRMATAASLALVPALYRLIAYDFLYYDLYGLILSVIAAPVAVLLISPYFSRKKVGENARLCGILSLSAAVVFACRELNVYGVGVGCALALFLTLSLTRRRGIVVGMISGTLLGLMLSPSQAPLFAFAALTAGLLFSLSVSFASSAAFSVGMAWSIYVMGLHVLNGILGGLLCGAVLFSVCDRLFFLPTEAATPESPSETEHTPEKASCETLKPSRLDGLRLDDSRRRMKEMGEGLSSLSDVFYRLSGQMQTPTAADLKQICDNAFDGSCAGCPDRDRCWSEQYRETCDALNGISAALHRTGRVEREDVDDALRMRCSRLPDVLEEINHNAATHRRRLLLGDRTEVFAMDYRLMSELLMSALAEQDREFETDRELSEELCRVLSESGASGFAVAALKGRRRRVVISAEDEERLRENVSSLRTLAATVCPYPLEEDTSIREGILELREAVRLSVSCAKRTLCAEGEDRYCGDTVGIFSHPDGYLYALISDGMGSGREAALTSSVSGLFLKKMLGAGNSCETALRMLNGFLRNRGSGSIHECSATVDLMELDLLCGRTAFYKSGAAPTYVFREGSLFKLRSHTVPVGILREPDAKRISFDLTDGDVVVMVSDGVTGGKEECPWLFDLLRSRGESASADSLCELIMKYAKREGSTDDLSVLVLKISAV